MIRVFEAFAGYGSQMIALKQLEKKWNTKMFQSVGWSEIEKNAIKAYKIIHGEESRNFGDICAIDWNDVPDFDLFTYSFPCQDISNAGLQKGFKEGSGTRSGLLWECAKAIQAKHPKYLVMENVKALVSKKFLPDFLKWIQFLEEEHYHSVWSVMNAKDYGIPQNRERVFCISTLEYQFAPPIPLDRCMQDLLQDESEVDAKYYCSPDKLAKFQFDERFLAEYNRINREDNRECGDSNEMGR